MKTKASWTQNTLEKIAAGELSEGEIRILRQRIGHAMSRYSWAKISADEAEKLLAAVEANPPRVTDAQAEKGARWLHKVAFTSKGLQRKTDLAREFSAKDLLIISELQNAPRFDLIGFEEYASGYGRHDYMPIYRARGASGSFDYVACAWQSGGRPFVSSHA